MLNDTLKELIRNYKSSNSYSLNLDKYILSLGFNEELLSVEDIILQSENQKLLDDIKRRLNILSDLNDFLMHDLETLQNIDKEDWNSLMKNIFNSLTALNKQLDLVYTPTEGDK